MMKYGMAFLKLCGQAGLSRKTGWLYWKLIFTVLMKNPQAIEPVVNLAAMFIHFEKQSRFIIDLATKEIAFLERLEEETCKETILQPYRNFGSYATAVRELEAG